MTSRIAGILGQAGADAPGALVRRMLSAIGRGSSGVAEAGPAALGALGERKPHQASPDGLLASVDGTFYNRDELPAAESEAEVLLALHRAHGFADALRRVNGDFAAAI